jgi:hypothetical protein
VRVNLPDQFLDEYWDKSKSVRRVVVPSAFALLQAHGQDGAVDKLVTEGWSKEFSAWLMPKVDMLRSDLEIEAIPVLDDYEVQVERFKNWKARKEKFRRIWIIGLIISAVCLLSTIIVLLLNSTSISDVAAPVLNLLSITGNLTFVVGMMQYKGKPVGTGILVGFCFGLGILYAAFISDDNKMVEPVKPASYDEKVRLVMKIEKIREAEASQS